MSTQQTITHGRAEEAVCIHFEGNVDHAPSILDVRLGGTTRQFVVEAELASYGELANPRSDVSVATLEAALGLVRELATGRVVAGLTTQELDVVATYCGQGSSDLVQRLRRQAARHGAAAERSKGARLHWWRIVSHNVTDLEAAQALTVRALEGDH